MKKALSPWYVIGLAYSSLFVFGLADNGRGPIFPDLLREFSLSDSQGGLFFFVASTAALVNNLLLFGLMERKGAYWILRVYSLAQALGLVLVGWAPTYTLVLIGCFLFGTSFGGLGISHNVLVSEAAPESRRRQLLAGLHSTYGVASLAVPLFVTVMYHLGFSWRAVSFSLALGPLAVFLASFKINGEEYNAPIESSEGKALSRPWKMALVYSLIATGYVVAEIGLSSRLALLVRRDWGYEVDTANLLVSGFFLGLFIGRIVFAFVPIKYSDSKILALSGCASLIAFSLGLLHHPLWLALTGLTMSMFYPVVFAMVKHETGRYSGYVTSWCFTVQALGLMLMHIVMGALSDQFGLARALWIGPLCLAFSLLVLLVKPKFQPNFPS